MTPSYDVPAPYSGHVRHYDLVSRVRTRSPFIAETRCASAHRAAGRPRVDVDALAAAPASAEATTTMHRTGGQHGAPARMAVAGRRACGPHCPRRVPRHVLTRLLPAQPAGGAARQRTGERRPTPGRRRPARACAHQRRRRRTCTGRGAGEQLIWSPSTSTRRRVRAVGHDGVVLQSVDGGAAGRASSTAAAWATPLVAYGRSAAMQSWTDAKRFAAQGAENPPLTSVPATRARATWSAPSASCCAPPCTTVAAAELMHAGG